VVRIIKKNNCPASQRELPTGQMLELVQNNEFLTNRSFALFKKIIELILLIQKLDNNSGLIYFLKKQTNQLNTIFISTILRNAL
jgi:hypothetical protein